MDPEITPEQKEQLKAWAGQRDALLLEIQHARVEKEKLEKTNNDLTISHTNTQADTNVLLGRIIELKQKEKDLNQTVSFEVATNLSVKTRLESEITGLRETVKTLSEKKSFLEKDVTLLTETFNAMKNRIEVLDKVVGHVTTVSEQNIRSLDAFVENLKTSLGAMVAVNQKNVTETNVVLEKLPKMLVEIQKRGLIKNKI